MPRRPLQEINAGSMADIAFLLLIFFLVTTTMDVDSGITRQLPPPVPDDQEPPPPIRERNVFIVLLNKDNYLYVEKDILQIEELKKATKDFILNPQDKDNLPERSLLSEQLDDAISKGKEKEAEKLRKYMGYFGNIKVAKTKVVSLQHDRNTDYGKYIEVQNEFVAAFNEVREEFALKYFRTTYEELEEEKQDAIRGLFPQSISEAEPRSRGG
jgi:biopolymer transport protein ExbD